MHKKPPINRKSKRIKKRVVLFFYSIVIVCVVGISVSWLLSLNKPSLVSPVAFGKTVDQSSQIKATVTSLLTTYDLQAETVSLVSNGIIYLKLSTGEEVFLSSMKDLDTQIHSLQLTLAHFTIVNKRITRFDDRFDKPVITFAQ